MDFGFKVATRARNDLLRIWKHIARDDRMTADRFCDELMRTAKSLRTLPQRHGNFAKRPNIRKVPHGNYLIFYKIDEENQTVEILRFWHAARNQRGIRLKEEPPLYASSPENLATIAPALEAAPVSS